MESSMSNTKIFSKHYSKDIEKHKDKPKFRARILRYLEDFNQCGFPHDTYLLCRHELGIDIIMQKKEPRQTTYKIVDTFKESNIETILDLITIVHDANKKKYEENKIDINISTFYSTVNSIFREESMCYTLNDKGRVRYYPDEEFQKNVENTLETLNNPKFSREAAQFNSILDDLYKNPNTELPIENLFDCIESLVLSKINDSKYNRLNEASIDKLMNIITTCISTDPTYTIHDIEIFTSHQVNKMLLTWAISCHKYRHGKQGQENKNVPNELFNYLFSHGVSNLRILLQLFDKFQL